MKTLTLSVCTLVVAGLAFAGSAHATSFWGGGYPAAFAYEGGYPGSTPCRYGLNQSRQAVWEGRLVRLKYFYSGRCGSFARIENAPRSCWVTLERAADGRVVGWVTETVDPGIDYAYTKVGNNLAGRISRGQLVCRDSESRARSVATTNWY